MDERVYEIAHRLQTSLERIDPQADRDTLIWAHGFLAGLLNQLQARVPEVKVRRKRPSWAKDDREESQRLTSELLERAARLMKDDPDSLEKIERELGEPGAAPVSAKRKPGPKGLIGGVALPLPESDLTM